MAGRGRRKGVVAAVVEVELEAGEVHLRKLVAIDDFGNVVNPMIVVGQVHGSLMQGIGQALYEEVEYAPDGQLLTASFMDYVVPVATNQVDLVIERLVYPAPFNALGAPGNRVASKHLRRLSTPFWTRSLRGASTISRCRSHHPEFGRPSSAALGSDGAGGGIGLDLDGAPRARSCRSPDPNVTRGTMAG